MHSICYRDATYGRVRGVGDGLTQDNSGFEFTAPVSTEPLKYTVQLYNAQNGTVYTSFDVSVSPTYIHF